MKVTIRYNTPIGDYKAIEHIETFNAIDFWQPENTSLVYFKLDRYNIKTVGKDDIIKIEM